MVSPLMELAKVFNNFLFKSAPKRSLLAFIVGGCQVGLIRKDVLDLLEAFPNIFIINDKTVSLKCNQQHYSKITETLADVLDQLKINNKHVALRSWRDENFEVKPCFSSVPLFEMERAATCMFGIMQYGVDINGYIIHPDKGLCIWVQKRALNKPTWPNKYDNMVGGGLTAGIDPYTCCMKEAKEEASIPDELLKNVECAGCVSFFFESERGLFPNTEFVFDLQLPVEFIPHNEDGEVESFNLLTAKEYLELIKSEDYKTTSCPVGLDFLIRHGVINTSNEPDLPELVELLHLPLHRLYSSTCWLSSLSQVKTGDESPSISRKKPY